MFIETMNILYHQKFLVIDMRSYTFINGWDPPINVILNIQ
jgi:hypothetical protein